MQIEWWLKIKNNSGWCKKKTKKLTEIQVLIKMFTQRVFEKTKITQLFKSINYWEIAANALSN